MTHLQNNGIKVEKPTSIIANLPCSIFSYVFPMWEKVCRKINDEDTLVSLLTILNMEIWFWTITFGVLYSKVWKSAFKEHDDDCFVELDIFKKETLVVQFIDCWEGHNRDIPTYEGIMVKFKKHTSTLAKLDAFHKKLMTMCFQIFQDGYILDATRATCTAVKRADY